MNKVILTITLLLVQFNYTYALETDQYSVWRRTLEDSTDLINEYLNENTIEVLEEINESKDEFTCSQVTIKALGIYDGPVFTNYIESWILSNDDIDQWPSNKLSSAQRVAMTIYRDCLPIYLWTFGTTLRVNDVYLGIDKISHLISTGNEYFTYFVQLKEDNYSDEEATIKAMDWGITQEKTYFGYLTSGVFSFADLEANYQGLLLARNFCEGESPYIEKENGIWQLKKEIDIRPYINPYMDESYYLSHYINTSYRNVWGKVKKHLKHYCDLRHDPTVVERMEQYDRRVVESFSSKYLKEQVELGNINDPQEQSLDLICD